MPNEKVKKKIGRPVGALGKKTIQKELGVDAATLDPPKPHDFSKPWTEKEAIAELEFLIRFLDNMDRTKMFFGQCLSFRGYKKPTSFYRDLVKMFPESNQCAELLACAKDKQREKLATLALTKDFDSRFGVFAMQNLSDWRQTQQMDVSTNVSIHAKDYKGIQPIISKRMEDKKKGS
jgi:hypothetical protein